MPWPRTPCAPRLLRAALCARRAPRCQPGLHQGGGALAPCDVSSSATGVGAHEEPSEEMRRALSARSRRLRRTGARVPDYLIFGSLDVSACLRARARNTRPSRHRRSSLSMWRPSGGEWRGCRSCSGVCGYQMTASATAPPLRWAENRAPACERVLWFCAEATDSKLPCRVLSHLV